MKFWCLSICQNSVAKIEFSLETDKSNGYFTWRPMYIYGSILLSSSYGEKYFRRSCGENQNTHFVLDNIYIFFSENCAVSEKTWKNMVQPGRLYINV